MFDPDDELWTPAEVAAYARVDATTVTRWARRGQLRVALVTPGGHRRYRRADVIATMAPPDDVVQACCAAGELDGHDGPCVRLCDHCQGSGQCPVCAGSSDDGSGLELTCNECGDGACPLCEGGKIIDPF